MSSSSSSPPPSSIACIRRYRQYYLARPVKMKDSDHFKYKGHSVLFIATKCGVMVFSPLELFMLLEGLKQGVTTQQCKPFAQQRFMSYKKQVTNVLKEYLVIYTFSNCTLRYVSQRTPFINVTQLTNILTDQNLIRAYPDMRDVGSQLRRFLGRSHLYPLVQRPNTTPPPAAVQQQQRVRYHAPITSHVPGRAIRILAPPPQHRPAPRYPATESDDDDDDEEEDDESEAASAIEARNEADADDDTIVISDSDNEDTDSAEAVTATRTRKRRREAEEEDETVATRVRFSNEEHTLMNSAARVAVEEMPAASELQQYTNRLMLGRAIVNAVEQISAHLRTIQSIGTGEEEDDDEDNIASLLLTTPSKVRSLWEANSDVVEQTLCSLVLSKGYKIKLVDHFTAVILVL